MFCGNCGAKLRDDDRFCPKCGAKTRLARQMEQTPEETAVPASSSSSAESASNAGAKPRKTVRLKSVPTGQVQNDSKPEQVGPVKTEPEPAVPVKEESQEKLPQQAAEPAGASESEPVYHALEPEKKDTSGGESIRCGSCGAALKAGTKFCPECGAPQTNNGESGSFSDRAYQYGNAGNPMYQLTKPKQVMPKNLKIFVAVAAVVVVVFIGLLALGSSNNHSAGTINSDSPTLSDAPIESEEPISQYEDGLIKANNAYGLSTTMSQDEYIEYFNNSVIKYLGITDDLDYNLQCIVNCDNTTVYEESGLTEYRYPIGFAAMTTLKQVVYIVTDSETGNVAEVQFQYTSSGYNSSSTSDSARAAVYSRMMATFDALYKGDPDKLHRAVEIMQSLIESDESTVWEDGILYINSYDPDTDFLSVGFQCFTEQAYKDKFGL